MKNKLILVPSVTYAMKAKSILDKYSIRSFVERTPKNLAISSCGYCLFVPDNAQKAERLLRQSGIRVLGIASREDI